MRDSVKSAAKTFYQYPSDIARLLSLMHNSSYTRLRFLSSSLSGCGNGISKIVFGKAVHAICRFAVAEARLKALPAFVERRFIQCHAAGIRAEDGAYGAERCEFRRAFRARFDVRFIRSDVCFGKFVIEVHRVDIVTGAGRHRLLLIISPAVRVRETRGLLRFLP